MIDTTNEATRDIRDIVADPPKLINRTTNEFVREIRDTLSGGSSGDSQIVSPLSAIHYASTMGWNSDHNIISKRGHIYIYSDYQTEDIDGVTYNIPGIKVGDGTSYLVDLPFQAGGQSSSNSIKTKTKAEWDAEPLLVSQQNVLYIYSDYSSLGDGTPVSAMKIGDGVTYLIDLPFLGDQSIEFLNHVDDLSIHVTEDDRSRWNNKWRGYISNMDSENLIFTTEEY